MFRMLWEIWLRFGRIMKEPLQGAFNVSGFRIIYNPFALLRALEKYHMQKRIDTIQAQYGPIDGIVGMFNPKNGDVIIDFKEIIQMLYRRGASAIDNQLTETLAHELRHRWQFDHYGKFRLYWDKFAILIIANVIIWKMFILSLWKFTLNGISGDGIFSGLLVGILSLVLTLICFAFSAILSYYFCWIERDARCFSKKAVLDPVWQEVFKVN